jgi:hypothetical protein
VPIIGEVRGGGGGVHNSTNGPTLGPRKDRQIPITHPAHVKQRVKAMTFLSQNIKPTARLAPTVTSKKKSDKPSTTSSTAKENLVKKVVNAPLEALVPSVPAASTGPCPRVARTPPSIPAQHEADTLDAIDNSKDLGLNSHSDMLPDMVTTLATIQLSDTTIKEPQPYDLLWMMDQTMDQRSNHKRMKMLMLICPYV